MKEMKIVDGRLTEKSRGLLGDMVSYHYWKVDGKKIENLEIPDTLDAHIDVGKPIRATYQPGKDNVNRIWAVQLENEPVRSVVTIPFLALSLMRFSILPLMIAIFTFFAAYLFWENTSNPRHFSGSAYQLAWLALNLLACYRFMIKPMLSTTRGIKAFREYCAKPPASTSTAN